MNSKKILAACSALAISFSCAGVSATAAEADVTTVKINPANASTINGGVFEGWGTSLAWYGNRIGSSEKASREAAKVLYNADTGLGLNIIRYNVGGGDDPTHDHIARSDSNMPGYWTNYNAATGTFDYDFTKDANQRNVLMKSIEECPDMLVEMFSNSAPYFMTRSGCTSGTNDSVKDNITIDKMDDFAEYMATVVKHYVDEGVNVVSVEPMNEPTNGWNVSYYGVKQEGCSVTAGENQSAMILAMDEAMQKHGLGDLLLSGLDETSPFDTNKSLNKLSEEALGKLERYNTHTYTTYNSEALRKKAEEAGVNLWMSETDNGGTKGANSGEMGAALNFASQITADLNDLKPSAWIMWQAIGSYCDKNNQFDPDTMSQHDVDTNGFWGVCYADMNTESVVLTKKYYGFGQYTRYIRPGDTIISTSDYATTSAINNTDEQLKIVAFNTSGSDKTVKYDLASFGKKGTTVDVIRTSGDMATGENWAELSPLTVTNGTFEATLKANSITTFVVNGVTMPEGKTVTGTVKAPGTDSTPVDVTFVDNNSGLVAYETTSASDMTYSAENVLQGEYTVVFEKDNCVTRKYDLTLGEEGAVLDAELHLKGDVNGDGEITTADVGLANADAVGMTELTGYYFTVADVSGDGDITTSDVGVINAHVRGSGYLW